MTATDFNMDLSIFNTELSIPTAIFESREDLEVYLADVKHRREQRGKAREKRGYWQYAIQQVAAELALAQEDGDVEIVAELCGVLAEFERLLGTAPERIDPETEAHIDWNSLPPEILDSVPDKVVDRAELAELLESAVGRVELPAAVSLPAVEESRLKEPATLPLPDHAIIEAPAQSVHVVPGSGDAMIDPAISAEERELRIQGYRMEIQDIAEKWKTLDTEGLVSKHGGLNRSHCFSVRALACALNTIHACAFDERMEEPLLPHLRTVRDAMGLAREYANDRGSCLPFDDGSWGSEKQHLTAEEWTELAGRYERMIPAQEAWEWYEANRQLAPQIAQVSVLNGVAAAQQALYRTLEDFDGRDRLQSDLHTALVEAAKQTGYLTALKAETDFDELESLAATLEKILANAQRETREFQARKAKDARKQAALIALDCLFAEQSAIGMDLANVNKDREALFPVLDECLAAGIPPTNVQIRNALVECGPRLLDGELKYSRILDAVLAERERRELHTKTPVVEIEQEDEPSDAVIDEYKEVVSLFTADQRILILGGVPRQRVCDDLMEVLVCDDVKWLESKKSDKAVKFQNEIKKANILILVKNFAGHDMSEKGKEWIKSVGGHFIFLPSGYGVNQIIYQLYKQGGLARVTP